MAITNRFESASDRYGYYAYIEDGELIVGENWPREGGVVYRGTYRDAGKALADLKKNAESLYNQIVKYYEERLLEYQQMRFDPETKSILFKVKLHMDNGDVHNVLVRGRSQSGIVEKLMPKIPEVLMLQTLDARVIAVRSDKIYAAEFMPED